MSFRTLFRLNRHPSIVARTPCFGCVLFALVGCAPNIQTSQAKTAPASQTKPAPTSHENTAPALKSEAPPPPAALAETKPSLEGAALGKQLRQEQALLSKVFQLPGYASLEALGSGGQWLAFCEKTDAAPILKFALPSETSDAPVLSSVRTIVTQSTSGRFVVVEEMSGKLSLYDARSGSFPLESIAPGMSGRLLSTRLAFSEDEKTLAFLEDGGQSVALFSLDSPEAPEASKRSLALPEPTYRIEFQENWLVLSGGTAPETAPAFLQSLERRPCTSRDAYPDHAALREPSAETKQHISVVPPELTTPLAAPGFLTILGTGFVRRDEQGRLLLVRGTTQEELSGSSCGARILGVDSDSSMLAIACEEFGSPKPETKAKPTAKKTPPKLKFPLYLVGSKYKKDLEGETMRTGVDVTAKTSARFVPLRLGAEATLLDLVERKLVRLGSEAFVLSVFPEGALFRRGNELLSYSPQKTEPVAGIETPFSPLVTSGPYFASGAAGGSARDGAKLKLNGALIALTAQGVAFSHTPENAFSIQQLRATSQEANNSPALAGR